MFQILKIISIFYLFIFIKVPQNTLEEEMATHSSILAWKISWRDELGGLQSMGLQRFRHYSDWAYMHHKTKQNKTNQNKNKKKKKKKQMKSQIIKMTMARNVIFNCLVMIKM